MLQLVLDVAGIPESVEKGGASETIGEPESVWLEIDSDDLALIYDQRVPLGPHPGAEGGGVYLQAERAGELGVRVGEHADLASCPASLAPSRHHVRVVHRHARDDLHPCGFEVLVFRKVARQVRFGTAGRERAGNSKQNTALHPEQFFEIDRVLRRALEDLDRRQLPAHLGNAQHSTTKPCRQVEEADRCPHFPGHHPIDGGKGQLRRLANSGQGFAETLLRRCSGAVAFVRNVGGN
mmetsp:Transcript_15782/g.26632  ORF Transcript_15782/g.26632 Transcript_15782/m.26632 type:complete len:237 (+) Transcript_15782:160-870(+)